ncbi:MAG: DNA-directed RNA polymerase subunit K [Candidatus Diapherotrites archaeon]|nr:DNA-directed RNA polymerase subunit K [Candidatus Diapherotrites archaeon]
MKKLTRFEIARIIGARALQLSLGAPPLIKPDKDETSISVAKKEFEQKVLPIAVIRTYADGTFEKVEI